MDDERISRILELREILLPFQTGLNPVEDLLDVYEDMEELLLVLEMSLTKNS